VPPPAVQEALKALPKPAPGLVHVAGAWVTQGESKKAADVDLWLRPDGSAVELSFKMPASERGRLLRDNRRSFPTIEGAGPWIAAWEVIELSQTTLLDLREHSTLWLNLFQGPGAPVTGVVRVSAEGREFDVPFSFPAIPGDNAQGRDRRDTSPCWIQVDLRKLLAAVPGAAK
jgi:hypothetical protein